MVTILASLIDCSVEELMSTFFIQTIIYYALKAFRMSVVDEDIV